MRKGNVKKYTRNKGYESISRDMVQDIENLSLQAIGLLSHLISLPDDFVIFKTVLYRRFDKHGRRFVENAWNELVKNNYIIQFRKRNESGKFEYIYYFSQEKFKEDDIVNIEKMEGTKRWEVEKNENNEEQEIKPLHILNSGQADNGKTTIYKYTNKDLLLNKDIDKDTIDTPRVENNHQTTKNKSSKNDYMKNAFYKNKEKIPEKLANMFEAFYGDDIDKAKKVYSNVLIAKSHAEKQTSTVIQLEHDSTILDIIINTLSRCIRKTEKENINNPSGYIYKSVFNALFNEITSRQRKLNAENGVYYDWLNEEVDEWAENN